MAHYRAVQSICLAKDNAQVRERASAAAHRLYGMALPTCPLFENLNLSCSCVMSWVVSVTEWLRLS